MLVFSPVFMETPVSCNVWTVNATTLTASPESAPSTASS
jgi:hypothetical protein